MITHPEKVLFPDDGITKRELAAYYESIAPIMLPHVRGRPVTMERYPSGIGKKGFWQKNVSKGFPEWLKRVEVSKKDGTGVGAVYMGGDRKRHRRAANIHAADDGRAHRERGRSVAGHAREEASPARRHRKASPSNIDL